MLTAVLLLLMDLRKIWFIRWRSPMIRLVTRMTCLYRTELSAISSSEEPLMNALVKMVRSELPNVPSEAAHKQIAEQANRLGAASDESALRDFIRAEYPKLPVEKVDLAIDKARNRLSNRDDATLVVSAFGWVIEAKLGERARAAFLHEFLIGRLSPITR